MFYILIKVALIAFTAMSDMPGGGDAAPLGATARMKLTPKENDFIVAQDRAAYNDLQKATEYLRKGDLVGAKGYAVRVVEADGGAYSSDGNALLALVALEEGNNGEVLSRTEATGDPENPHIAMTRARALLNLGDVEGARQLLDWYASMPWGRLFSEFPNKDTTKGIEMRILAAYGNTLCQRFPLLALKALAEVRPLVPRNPYIARSMANALQSLGKEKSALGLLAIVQLFGEESHRIDAMERLAKYSPEARESALQKAKLDPRSVY